MTDKRMGARGVAATIALLLAALGAAWSAVVLVAGGFTIHVGSLALTSRDPLRPLAIAVALVLAARILLPRGAFAARVRAIVGTPDRWAARTACAAAAATLVFAIAWNTRAAGGSDSSCYVLQADAFAHGHVVLTDPLAARLPGAAPAMFAPIGFLPSPVTPFAPVPICGPGLSLVMAAALLIGGRPAVFVVVPAFAALAVWLTFAFGRQLDDEATGAAGAALLACSPIFLYQSVQPMSDVPAAALWLAAVVSLGSRGGSPPATDGSARRQIVGGACASLAVLTRPNLALAVIPLLGLLPSWRAGMRFCLAALPGVAALAWLNALRYGSPLVSGYGDAGALFALAHVWPNLLRYGRWLLETQSPFICVAVGAPWLMRTRSQQRLTAVAAASATLVVLTYLAYTVFDDWWYLRFLLPMLPVAIVFGVAAARRLLSRASTAAGLLALAGLGFWYVHVARARQVFDLQALESRFVLGGRAAAQRFPPQTVFLAVQQSGSIRYHGGLSTIAWDGIPVGALDRTIASLDSLGRRVVIALEDAEEPRFRTRFAGEADGALDWPPAVELHGRVRVRFYDVRDRPASSR
ncbi:MAG TPA: glycosyltransferase family 39 protein [Vicinamibacterales bacterium]|nr:glycosyltransferase family 39 protein [Vicinamibacterales bacterium]